MSGNNDEMAADLERMVGQLGLSGQGGFDPMALLAGASSFHSVFIAPLTPSFTRSRDQFLADGTGPLAAVVDDLKRQGLDEEKARATARDLLGHAHGMLVAVIARDGAVMPVPQPWFGHLSPEFQIHAVAALGDGFAGKEALGTALITLAGRQPVWPVSAAGPEAQGDPAEYWQDLAAGLVAGAASPFARGANERLADLAWWCGDALRLLDRADASSETLELRVRCHALALDTASALPLLVRLADSTEADADAFAGLLTALADAVVPHGGDEALAQWLGGPGAALAKRLGCAYDAALTEVRIAAAAGSPAIAEAADRLWAANRKSARQDLTREPLWQVTAADPGPLLDTAAAATLIGRSTQFLAKKLEQGTIPLHREERSVPGARSEPGARRVRLPEKALLAWKQVMDAYRLLD